jgi:TolB-like protein
LTWGEMEGLHQKKENSMCLRNGFIAFLIAILWSTGATGEKIAVFPLEDLSQGANGVNFALMQDLEDSLRDKGFEVVSQEAIMSFMARNRIRRLGFLNTYSILHVREELGVDTVLLGTVCQRREEPCPAFALTLYLVRTEDARTIWSKTKSLSCSETRHLLAISEPQSSEDLIPMTIQDILASWPATSQLNRAHTPIFELAEADIRPRNVSAGNRVTCSVRLRSVVNGLQPEVSIKIQPGMYLRMQPVAPDLYETSWMASAEEGRYAVTLVLEWPSGRQRVALLGTYNVDNSPPSLALGIKGVRLQGAVAFRDRVFVVPQLREREPISRWEFSIKDENGRTILQEERNGALPARFVWRGQGDDGVRVSHGAYQVVVKAWDEAENAAQVCEKIAVMRNPPDMILEAKMRGEDTVLGIRSGGGVPIAFWRVEMRNNGGSVIKTAEGQALPAEVDVTAPEDNVECVLTAMDILGNQVRRKIKDLKLLAKHEDIEKTTPANTWLTEF